MKHKRVEQTQENQHVHGERDRNTERVELALHQVHTLLGVLVPKLRRG